MLKAYKMIKLKLHQIINNKIIYLIKWKKKERISELIKIKICQVVIIIIHLHLDQIYQYP